MFLSGIVCTSEGTAGYDAGEDCSRESKAITSSERPEVKDWGMGKLIGGYTVRKWLAHLHNLGNMHSVEFITKYVLMAEYLLFEKNTQIVYWITCLAVHLTVARHLGCKCAWNRQVGRLLLKAHVHTTLRVDSAWRWD